MRKWMDGMNAEAMDKWMRDLRSGEFEQAIGVLQSLYPGNKGMCCLGVVTDTNVDACDLIVQRTDSHRVRYSWANEEGDYIFASSTLLPLPVAEYLGIPESHRDGMGGECSLYVKAHGEEYVTESVSLKVGYNVTEVTLLNDDEGLSFEEIADRIEETFMVEV